LHMYNTQVRFAQFFEKGYANFGNIFNHYEDNEFNAGGDNCGGDDRKTEPLRCRGLKVVYGGDIRYLKVILGLDGQGRLGYNNVVMWLWGAVGSIVVMLGAKGFDRTS